MNMNSYVTKPLTNRVNSLSLPRYSLSTTTASPGRWRLQGPHDSQAQGIREKPDFCCAHLKIDSVKGLGLTPSKTHREHSRLMIEAKAYEANRSVKGLGFTPSKTDREHSGLMIEAKAYEGNRSDNIVHQLLLQQEEDESESSAQRLKIAFYFATWWALNVVFNIYNKKVLNVFPYPWLTSTLSLAAGSAIMLATWATRVVEAPETDLQFWKALIPVAIAHTIGHVAATVSMSKVAVSFTHVIKSAEPAFSIVVSRCLLGQHFPLPVYLSLLPIVGGCSLAAATELNFNLIGFMGAMISNLAFVFRNIFSKKGMEGKGKSVGGMNYYACLSMLSLAILTPFAFVVEGPRLWATGWHNALHTIGPQFAW